MLRVGDEVGIWVGLINEGALVGGLEEVADGDSVGEDVGAITQADDPAEDAPHTDVAHRPQP